MENTGSKKKTSMNFNKDFYLQLKQHCMTLGMSITSYLEMVALKDMTKN